MVVTQILVLMIAEIVKFWYFGVELQYCCCVCDCHRQCCRACLVIVRVLHLVMQWRRMCAAGSDASVVLTGIVSVDC